MSRYKSDTPTFVNNKGQTCGQAFWRRMLVFIYIYRIDINLERLISCWNKHIFKQQCTFKLYKYTFKQQQAQATKYFEVQATKQPVAIFKLFFCWYYYLDVFVFVFVSFIRVVVHIAFPYSCLILIYFHLEYSDKYSDNIPFHKRRGYSEWKTELSNVSDLVKIKPKHANIKIKFLSLKIKNTTKYLQSLLAFSHVFFFLEFLVRWFADSLSSDVKFKWLVENNNKN